MGMHIIFHNRNLNHFKEGIVEMRRKSAVLEELTQKRQDILKNDDREIAQLKHKIQVMQKPYYSGGFW